ncbi:LysE family translocator [Nocardioides oleivorans]|uniref:LysE family translocator n=1 Tax=Nocardioides oleivorans TaxID=273676 RepID=A0A4V1RL09_9ACTN|nr:LysE family translocator [Nocardioides oleivorans]RYB94142.1 LysE family translocator [Nocardioides oleivorans]
MPSSSQWLAFLLASFLFIQVPGPSLLFTIGRALTVGRREALLSVLGNGLGVLVQVVLVAIGLGALVAASAAAYTAIKVAGAAYVIFLGIQAVRHRADARLAMVEATPVRRGHPVRIGLTVGATNPKTMVFFVAFLPQFIDPGGPVLVQTLVLGLVFSAMAVMSDSTWAMVAGAARTWFARRPQRLDVLSAGGGTMMIGLGATMLATE